MSDLINLNDYASELATIQNDNSNVSLMSAEPISEPKFIVNANSREISVPSQFEYIGVYNDHNAETVYFKIDRYFDDIDLSQKTCVILFMNPRGETGYSINSSMSVLDNEIIIGWTINHEHTAAIGTLTFALCFYHIDENTHIFDYRWSTKPATTKVLPGLELVRGQFDAMKSDDLEIILQKIDDIYEQVSSVNSLLETKADKETESGGFVGGRNTNVADGGAAVGMNAVAYSGGAAGMSAYADSGAGAVGLNAYAHTGGAVGREAYADNGGGAVGYGAEASGGGAVGRIAYTETGGAVGQNARTSDGFAGGKDAKCEDSNGSLTDAIQLGTGTNVTAKTLQVYDYKLMNADGTIPYERYGAAVDAKIAESKPTITTLTDTELTLTLNHNTETRCGEVATMSINMPTSISDDYISSISFTSGTTPVNLNYPDTIKMVGEDCIDNVFAPVTNKRYNLLVIYDGAYCMGIVGGYRIPTA